MRTFVPAGPAKSCRQGLRHCLSVQVSVECIRRVTSRTEPVRMVEWGASRLTAMPSACDGIVAAAHVGCRNSFRPLGFRLNCSRTWCCPARRFVGTITIVDGKTECHLQNEAAAETFDSN